MLHCITDASAISNLEVELRWDDGTVSVVDFRTIIVQGGVFTPLADPEVFAQVTVDSSGRFIFWPGDIDFCADALYVASTSLAER
jgi:hypothetical protein